MRIAIRDAMLHPTKLLRVTGASTLSLFFTDRLGITRQQLFAQIADTLNPAAVPKFATPMLVPPVMPRAGTITLAGGKNADYYEISMKQFTQQITCRQDCRARPSGDMAPWHRRTGAVCWCQRALPDDRGEVEQARSREVDQRSEGWRGDFLHEFRCRFDPTLHWVNLSGGTSGRDMRPAFRRRRVLYTGPVPIVMHVHGAVGVADDSDGYAEAWKSPAARNIPEDYATVGTWFDFFAGKAENSYGVNWQPGSAVFHTRTRTAPRRSGITTTRWG